MVSELLHTCSCTEYHHVCSRKHNSKFCGVIIHLDLANSVADKYGNIDTTLPLWNFYASFFKESTKQDCFQLFTNYCASYFAYFQVFEDLYAIWDWILIEKLCIPLNQRNMYSAILVLPDTFDNRGIFISNGSLFFFNRLSQIVLYTSWYIQL